MHNKSFSDGYDTGILRDGNSRNMIFISDFDDTLFFTDKSINAASMDMFGKNLSWSEIRALPGDTKHALYNRAYTTYMDLLEPNTRLIDAYTRHINNGAEVIILSARGEELRTETEQMLKKYGIPYREVILPADHSTRDQEWKCSLLEKLLEKESSDLLFVEDKTENLEYARSRLLSDRVKYLLVTKEGISEYAGKNTQ